MDVAAHSEFCKRYDVWLTQNCRDSVLFLERTRAWRLPDIQFSVAQTNTHSSDTARLATQILEAFDTIGRTDVAAASDSCEGANSDMLVMYRVCLRRRGNTMLFMQSMLRQIDWGMLSYLHRPRERKGFIALAGEHYFCSKLMQS